MTRTRTPTRAEYAYRKYVRDPLTGQPRAAKPMSAIDVQLEIANEALTRTGHRLASATAPWLRERLTAELAYHRRRVERLVAQKAAEEAGEASP